MLFFPFAALFMLIIIENTSNGAPYLENFGTNPGAFEDVVRVEYSHIPLCSKITHLTT